MDDGRLFAATVIGGFLLAFAVLAGSIFGAAIFVGERNCARIGMHLGVPSVYDRWQDTCYLTVDGKKIPDNKFFVNQEAK